MSILDSMKEEREANQFAMELLMPVDFVKREIAKIGGLDMTNEKQVKKLAEIFKVPHTVMAMRIGQLEAEKLL